MDLRGRQVGLALEELVGLGGGAEEPSDDDRDGDLHDFPQDEEQQLGPEGHRPHLRVQGPIASADTIASVARCGLLLSALEPLVGHTCETIMSACRTK